MIVNFAERAHNHNWELDPVIRSLQAPDVAVHLEALPKTRVAFLLINRSSWVRLADMFATGEIG
jgi:nicotinate phosphoribosyltransferase